MFSRAIAFAPVFFVAIAALAATTTVTPSNLGTWTMQNAHCSGGTNSGTTAIVAGPATPPLGSGSAQITIGTDGDSFDGFRTPDFNGTLLSALTTLSYSTYTQVDGSGGQSPYLLLNLDFDNDGVLDDQIFFEPVYQSATYFPSNPQGPLTTATWQTWDALNGGWWSVNSTAGADPGTNVKSLAAIIAAQPNARILAPGPGTGSFRVMGGCGGSAWTSYVGNFDGVNVGVTGTVTTYDFEPAPSITINDRSIAEGTGGTTNLVFTLTLSQAVSQTVTVNYTTADDTATVADGDYTLTAGTATFTPFSTTATISVPIGTDNEFEPSETFFVNLTGAANATIADNQGVGTITNDDGQPTITITDVSGPESITPFPLTIQLSNPSYQTITIDYATADGTATAGSDYTAIPTTTATIPPGQTLKQIDVQIINDAVDETNETFFLNLSNATNATITDNQGMATINDDDPAPSLSINSPSQLEGNGGSPTMIFTVTLTPASGQTVTVAYNTANGTALAGSDYSVTSGTLTFNPGVTTQPIAVPIVADTTCEADETFTVVLSAPTSASLGTATGTGTIQNDDLCNADLSISKTVNGNGPFFASQNATFTITVTNSGPFAATSVTVTDVIPPGATFVSAASNQGSCSGTAAVTCNLGTLNNTASATIALTVALSAAGPMSNTAIVSGATNDPNQANNSSTAAITVQPSSAIPALDGIALLLLAAALAAVALTLSGR